MADSDSARFGAAALLGADGFTSAHLGNSGGNPGGDFAGANPGSPYAYVNLYAQDADSRLVSVVLRQDGGAGAFALDNLSVSPGLVPPPDLNIAAAPAPGTLLLLAPALAWLGWRRLIGRVAR